MPRNQRDTDHLAATACTVANGDGVITLSAEFAAYATCAPDAVTTSTIAKWLKVVDDGTDYYLPMWS